MKKSGFTLIELLIVVAIIGILAAIAVPNFLNAQIRAKIAKAESNLKTFTTAVEMYRMDNGANFPHTHTANQNKYLTTPVSYVGSIPSDPFQESQYKQNMEVLYSFGQFHRDPFWENGQQILDYNDRHRQSPDNIARAKTGKPDSYECWSVGPNHILDLPVFLYYQASNGLTSIGDIVWVRP